MGQVIGPIAADRRRIGANRLERLVELHQCQPAPQLRPRIVVGDPGGVLEVLQCDALTAQMEPGDPAPQIELRIHRIEAKAGGTRLERSLEVPQVPGDDTQREPRHGELRIGLDRFENDLLCLVILPLPVELVGLDEELLRWGILLRRGHVDIGKGEEIGGGHQRLRHGPGADDRGLVIGVEGDALGSLPARGRLAGRRFGELLVGILIVDVFPIFLRSLLRSGSGSAGRLAGARLRLLLPRERIQFLGEGIVGRRTLVLGHRRRGVARDRQPRQRRAAAGLEHRGDQRDPKTEAHRGQRRPQAPWARADHRRGDRRRERLARIDHACSTNGAVKHMSFFHRQTLHRSLLLSPAPTPTGTTAATGRSPLRRAVSRRAPRAVPGSPPGSAR